MAGLRSGSVYAVGRARGRLAQWPSREFDKSVFRMFPTEKADEDLCSATERLVFRGYYQELLFYGGGIQNLATKDLDQK